MSTSDVDSGRGSVDPLAPKDRHEPRGRKPNDGLPPSRAREVQRAFRLRRAEHLASLEERINLLESENTQLRALLNLPEADRPRIGSGPTGKGKALKEGGVPMSERVRARKEARERERRAKAGLPLIDQDVSSDASESVTGNGNGINRSSRDTETLSPRAGTSAPTPQLPLFNNPPNDSNAFNYTLPIPFNLPMAASPENNFPDFSSSLDSMFKNVANVTGATPNFSSMFSIFNEEPPTSTQPDQNQNHQQHNNNNSHPLLQQQQQHSHSQPHLSSHHNHTNHHNHNHNHPHSLPLSQNNSQPQQSHRQSPLTPPASSTSSHHNQTNTNTTTTTNTTHAPQPDLLTRLKVCCRLSDSHVVNDPGLLIFATRLCQSFPCQFSGVHPDLSLNGDPEHLMLEESWRALKSQLDPGGEADGENRINTGRMAAELVIRSAGSRGPGAWIICKYREGMSIKRGVIVGLVQGLGGKFD